MKFDKRTWMIVFIIIIILIVVLLLLAFRKPRGEKCPDGKPIPKDGVCKKSTSTHTVSDPIHCSSCRKLIDICGNCNPPTSYGPWYYPMRIGMKDGSFKRVQELQQKLNIRYDADIPEDGYFGCCTESAVKKYLGTDKVEEYDSIWNTPVPILG